MKYTIIFIFLLSGGILGAQNLKIETESGTDRYSLEENVEIKIKNNLSPYIISIEPDAAKPGAAVVINGERFGAEQGNSILNFNEVPATQVNSWSDSEIIALVPEGAESGIVTVTVNGLESNEYSFTVLAPDAPVISSVDPEKASPGDEITIIGSNFGAEQAGVRVLFNELAATQINSWADTEIKVTVPNEAESGKIYVVSDGMKSNGCDFIVLRPPVIFSIQPGQAPIGADITITGDHFGLSGESNTIFFNEISQTVFSEWDDTHITTKVPDGAATGKVRVNVSGMESNEVDFTVEPKITSLSNNSAPVGEEIEINGSGFGDQAGEVRFNEISCASKTWTSKKIFVDVPEGAESGKVSIVAGGIESNKINFTVRPGIEALTPDKAAIGDEIVIRGKCFGENEGAVLFNDIEAKINNWSDTEIETKVPGGAVSGLLKVKREDGTESYGREYWVKPKITSITPEQAKIYQEISIKGTSFGDTENDLYFKSYKAVDIKSWKDTEIKVEVPRNGRSGMVKVIKNEGVWRLESNEYEFYIIPQVTDLSYDDGEIGEEISVRGVSFGDSKGKSYVSFGDAKATEYSLWNDLEINVTIPEDADAGDSYITVTVLETTSNEKDFHVIGLCRDADGNVYKTARFVNQRWMVENLNVGTMINSDERPSDNDVIEKYCYDDNPANCNRYGGLYTWDEMMKYTKIGKAQGICPDGYHIPIAAEWTELEVLHGLERTQASKWGWRGDHGRELQEGEFKALFGGETDAVVHFLYQGDRGYFWSSNDRGTTDAIYYMVHRSFGGVYKEEENREFGFSVRCLRD